MVARICNEKTFVFIIVCAILLACTRNADESNNYEMVSDTKSEIDDFTQIDSTSSIEKSINLIAHYNTVHDKYIGEGAVTSNIYIAYQNIEKADFKQLFRLLKHDSVAVRVYAYYAIKSKNPSFADSAWNMVRGKEDSVVSMSGCMVMTTPIYEIKDFDAPPKYTPIK